MDQQPQMTKNDQISKGNAYQSAMFSAGPQLLDQGANWLANQQNPVVKTIGKVAKVGTSLIAPDQQKTDLITKGYKNPQLLNDQERSQLSNYALAPVMGMSLPMGEKGLSPNALSIHPDDQQIMQDFIHEVTVNGNGKGNLGRLGVDAQNLAEHYLGKNWSLVSNNKMAQAFMAVLDNANKIPDNIATNIGRIPRL